MWQLWYVNMSSNFKQWFFLKTGTDILWLPVSEQARQKAIYTALCDENEETGFLAWFKAYTGKDFLSLRDNAYRSNASNKEVAAFVHMKDINRNKYRLEKEQLAFYLEAPEEKPEFNRWLKLRTGKTSGQLYALARATGSYKSYLKLMDWYRNRYQLEYENPFLEAAKTAGTGE